MGSSALSFSVGTLTGSLCVCFDHGTTATTRVLLIKIIIAAVAVVGVGAIVASARET